MKPLPAFAVALALGAATAPSVARAQGLRYDPPRDLAITLGGAGAWILSNDLRGDLVPTHCRWCDVDRYGHDDLNYLDRTARRLRWRQPYLADEASNFTAFVGSPLAAGGMMAGAAAYDHKGGNTGSDVLVIAEAGVLAADVNQLVKFLAVRERPDAHARRMADPSTHPRTVDDDLSFNSGHTTESVSLAVAACTLASLRGYRLAPLVWATTLPLAGVTAYLRIAADRHYFTDVLTGAITGTLIGVIVPLVFNRPLAPMAQVPGSEPDRASASASASIQQGATIGWSGVW
jgi:membrane-associated phospholipid phosphatase